MAGPMAPDRATGRVVSVLCAIALAVSSVVAASGPVAAQSIDARIASVRAAQQSAEAVMREQDRVVLSLSAQRKAAAKQLKPLERALKAERAALAGAQAVLAERQSRLADREAAWAAPDASPRPSDWEERIAAIRKEVRIATSRLESIRAREQAALRAIRAKKSQIDNLKRLRAAAVGRREGAEASLSAYISQMKALAEIKIAQQATVSLAEGGTYSWPTTGRIVQPYGCTGFELNPRRGKCKHFHDGIDVVDAYGTPVRSVAAGVVAYAGWNPYDKEGRAYVVDVVHADGWVSRYGHLIPSGMVKSGDIIHTGGVLGRMGNTGMSTGTHLHFELLRGSSDVDPMDYLPVGVVQVDKSSTRMGLAELARSERAAKKKAKSVHKAPTAWRPPATPFTLAEKSKVASCTPDEQAASAGKAGKQKPAKGSKAPAGPEPGAVECEPSGLFAPAGGDERRPGIPIPYRGAPPAPG